jgi:hypothetical protein
MNRRTALVTILLLAILLRVGVALYLGDTVPAGKDEQSYSELAARLATGHGYSFDRPWYPFGSPAGTPTAHWSFLYTAFIAAVYRVAGPHPLAVRLLQAVLAGLLLPWLTYRLARRAGNRGQESGDRDQAPGANHNAQPPALGVSVPLLAAFRRDLRLLRALRRDGADRGVLHLRAALVAGAWVGAGRDASPRRGSRQA